MHKLLSCALLTALLVLVLAGCGGDHASKENAFRYGRGATWGMSPEEVIEIEAIRAPKRIDGRHLRSVQALGDPEGGTNVLKRTYLFWNDKLHMIVELVPMFIEEPQTVIDALSERYGEPGQGDAQRIAAALSQSGMPYNYERTLEHYSVDGIMLRDWETSDAYIWFERTSEYAMVYYCPLRLTRR